MQFLKSILFGALILISSSAMLAQGPRGGDRGFDLEKMTEQLDLTPEQATQLKTIHEAQRAAFAKLAEGLPEGERPNREQMRGVMKDSREKMMEVLTAEQQEKLKAEREKRRGDRTNKRHSKKNDALRTELRAYRAEVITPKFIEVRTAFDKKMSTTERDQINTLRTAIRAELGEKGLKQIANRGNSARGNRHVKRSSERIGKSSPARNERSKTKESHRAEMRAFMQKHSAEVEAVKSVVRNHESELTAVRKELDAAKAQWKKDGNAIRAKHLSAEELARFNARGENRAEMRSERKGHGEHAHPAKKGEGGAFGRAERGAFTFLLMDPESMSADGFEDEDRASLSAYPNPAKDETTVKFDVRASGPVIVELIDASGKVIKTLLNATREAQSYEFPVKFPASMGKAGLIRVTDAAGVRTIQIARN